MPVRAGLGIAVVLTLALGASGGVTALGDTLFPADSLADGIAQDFSPTAHFLIKLRVWHPLLAVVTAGWLIVIAGVTAGTRPAPMVRRAAAAVVTVVFVQVTVGAVNLLLLAPVPLQLLHLLLADLLWMALVVLCASAVGASPQDLAGEPPLQPVPSPN